MGFPLRPPALALTLSARLIVRYQVTIQPCLADNNDLCTISDLKQIYMTSRKTGVPGYQMGSMTCGFVGSYSYESGIGPPGLKLQHCWKVQCSLVYVSNTRRKNVLMKHKYLQG